MDSGDNNPETESFINSEPHEMTIKLGKQKDRIKSRITTLESAILNHLKQLDFQVEVQKETENIILQLNNDDSLWTNLDNIVDKSQVNQSILSLLRRNPDSETGVASSSYDTAVPNSKVIRNQVCNGFKEFFRHKMKKITDTTLSNDEIDRLASTVEEEIFLLHKRNTGLKCKNKYRRLLFNMKQPQNTLFCKIALEKTLSPYELVHLNVEVERTDSIGWTKHEINAINKVQSSKKPKKHLDPESESLLRKSDLLSKSATEQEDEFNVEKPLPIRDKGEEKKCGDNGALKDKKLDGTYINNAITVIGSENKHRTHRDHKLKYKSRRKRHHSSKREEFSDQSRKRIKSTHECSKSTDDQSHRLCENSTVLEKHTSVCWSGDIRKISRSDDCLKKSHSHSPHISDHDAEGSRRRKKSKKSRSRSASQNRKGNSEEQTSVDRSNGINCSHSASKDSEPVLTVASVTTDTIDVRVAEVTENSESKVSNPVNSLKNVDVNLSSNKHIPTINPDHTETISYIWRGTLVLPNVLKFEVVLKPVSGNCKNLYNDLHTGAKSVINCIDCVGRVDPAIVWNHIVKVKNSNRKDIIVLRVDSAKTDGLNYYKRVFCYLNSLNRIAVVRNTGTAIEDFYIMPLASNSAIPAVLLPLDGPGLNPKNSRPNLLLAVIVRNRYHSA